MKVFRDGIEAKDAVVEYGDDKKPAYVTASGLRQNASAFTFEDDEAKAKKKVTRKAPASKKKSA